MSPQIIIQLLEALLASPQIEAVVKDILQKAIDDLKKHAAR